MKYYAGIGSRSTSLIIQDQMIKIGSLAATQGWCLRSGAAKGADSAFEEGCDSENGDKQIFLPWKGFNQHSSIFYQPSQKAYELAKIIHPAYNKLSESAKHLLARNMHQIGGTNLDDPVEFVVCWTPDGCNHHTSYSKLTGGTGSAIALASKLDIPIYNLYNTDYEEVLKLFV